MYEDRNLKQKALNVIPVARLKADAQDKHESYLSSLKESKRPESHPLDAADFLAIELLAWFKNDFFKWVNKPECEVCGTNETMEFKMNGTPTGDEVIWMARNVEVYEYILTSLIIF
jgi:peptide-N4-(N-acetyl-beta-glucosaminyl)asparagine amidase